MPALPGILSTQPRTVFFGTSLDISPDISPIFVPIFVRYFTVMLCTQKAQSTTLVAKAYQCGISGISAISGRYIRYFREAYRAYQRGRGWKGSSDGVKWRGTAPSKWSWPAFWCSETRRDLTHTAAGENDILRVIFLVGENLSKWKI